MRQVTMLILNMLIMAGCALTPRLESFTSRIAIEDRNTIEVATEPEPTATALTSIVDVTVKKNAVIINANPVPAYDDPMGNLLGYLQSGDVLRVQSEPEYTTDQIWWRLKAKSGINVWIPEITNGEPNIAESSESRTNVIIGYPSNELWTPVSAIINDVEMVLVPPGCFMMGHEHGLETEKPAHEQCFTESFWIDRYEVTNAQFRQFAGYAGRLAFWTEDDRPRNRITWAEARDYCYNRGARLPTEREWEYAARGPSNWLYPWGNEWIVEYSVNQQTSERQTHSVGSHLEGVSWVGAYDMAGNVYEWTSSKFVPATGSWMYPYRPDDGREEDHDLVNERVMRGGAWSYSETWLAATRREIHLPNYESFGIGIRCVVDR